MPEKSPETYAAATYLWIVLLAMAGGAVSYLKKLKQGKKWKMTDFAIEVFTAAFTGVVVFFLCESLGIPQVGTAAMVGVAGHFSSKTLTLMGEVLEKIIKKFGA